MRIAAIKLRQLGDTVLWTSALGALRTWKPEAEVHLIVPTPYTDLFSGDPRWKRVWDPHADLAALKKLHFDTVLVFHASARSKALAASLKADQRLLHHHSRNAKNYGSDVSIPDLGKPAAANQRDANVLRALGWTGTPPATALHLSPVMEAAARHAKAWRQFPDRRLAVLGPEASRPAKQWPLQRYATVAKGLEDAGWEVAIVLPPQSTLDASLRERWIRPLPTYPTPTLVDLVGILSEADLYVGSDSGAKHLAASVGTPTLTLFGPESLGEWHGYDRNLHPVLRHSLACRDRDPDPAEFSWCGVHTCPLASHACMVLTTPSQVLETVERVFPRR